MPNPNLLWNLEKDRVYKRKKLNEFDDWYFYFFNSQTFKFKPSSCFLQTLFEQPIETNNTPTVIINPWNNTVLNSQIQRCFGHFFSWLLQHGILSIRFIFANDWAGWTMINSKNITWTGWKYWDKSSLKQGQRNRQYDWNMNGNNILNMAFFLILV